MCRMYDMLPEAGKKTDWKDCRKEDSQPAHEGIYDRIIRQEFTAYIRRKCPEDGSGELTGPGAFFAESGSETDIYRHLKNGFKIETLKKADRIRFHQIIFIQSWNGKGPEVFLHSVSERVSAFGIISFSLPDQVLRSSA